MKQKTTTVQKKLCSIVEVAERLGVNIWTIRLWADRFDILKPCMNKNGGIFFSIADVNRIETLCRLTKEKKMTLKSAREYLKSTQEKKSATPIYECTEPDGEEHL